MLKNVWPLKRDGERWKLWIFDWCMPYGMEQCGMNFWTKNSVRLSFKLPFASNFRGKIILALQAPLSRISSILLDSNSLKNIFCLRFIYNIFCNALYSHRKMFMFIFVHQSNCNLVIVFWDLFSILFYFPFWHLLM